MKQTPLKKPQKLLKKTPLKKTSNSLKKVSVKKQKEIIEKKGKPNEVHLAMLAYWEKIPHICMSCERYLGNEFSTAFVDHLLPKSRFFEFAKDERNFFCCCLDCHSQKELGFPLPKHKEAIKKAEELLLKN